MPGPWSFDEAAAACRATSAAQKQAEDEMRRASAAFAQAEERYRMALAKEIVRQHAVEGVAWTVAPDLARGDRTVARLRLERDVAEGVREAMVQASWRRSADRKDAARFADWSMRRELADGFAQPDDRLAWSSKEQT